MLPIFHIRDLANRDIDEESRLGSNISQDLQEPADVQLDKPKQYDELIEEHPVAALGYIDEDDGEVITVGSSMELFDRVNELQSLRPIVFDLLASLRRHPDSSKTAEGIRVWAQFVNRKFKGKGKASIHDTSVSTSTSIPETLLIDVGDEADVTPKVASKNEKLTAEQKPLMTAFEQELKKILANEKDTDETSRAPPLQTYPCPPAETENVSPLTDVSKAFENVRWAVNSINRLRQNLPQCAQPTLDNLSTAVHCALGDLTMQLSQAAREASVRAQRAVDATREVEAAELEAVRERIRHLTVGLGHVAAQSAQNVGRDIGQGVHDGFGVMAIHAKKVSEEAKKEVMREVNKARREIERSARDAIDGLTPNSRENNVDVTFEAAEKEVVTEETIPENRSEEFPIDDDDKSSTRATTSSNPGVEFVPASQFKSRPYWDNRFTRSQENESRQLHRHTLSPEQNDLKEHDAAAFWQQMDKIAHYTTECGSSNPTNEEPREMLKKDDKNESATSHTAEDGREHRRWSRCIGRQSMYELRRASDGVAHHDRKRRLNGHNDGLERHAPPRLPSPPPHIPGNHPRSHSRLPLPPSPPSEFFSLYPPESSDKPGLAYQHAPHNPSFANTSGLSEHSNLYRPHIIYHRGNKDDAIGSHRTRFSQYPSTDDASVERASFEPYPQLRRARTVIGSSYPPQPESSQRPTNSSRSISPVPTDRPNYSDHRTWAKLSPTFHGLHSAPRLQGNVKTYSDREQIGVVNADPFATPPRIASPQAGTESETREQRVGHSGSYQDYESTFVPNQPSVEFQSAEMTEMPTTSFFGDYPTQIGGLPQNPTSTTTNPFSADINPFTAEAWKQTHLELDLPGSFPNAVDLERSEPQINDERQKAIDKCVAQLVEMGYGDNETNDGEEVERLKIYAQISEGNVDEALELLEEEKTAWARQI